MVMEKPFCAGLSLSWSSSEMKPTYPYVSSLVMLDTSLAVNTLLLSIFSPFVPKQFANKTIAPEPYAAPNEPSAI